MTGDRPFGSLLVPIDLTPSSDRILGRVALLPLADGARITLLHVIPKDLPRGLQLRVARDARASLAGEIRHLRKSLPGTVTVSALVTVGVAAKEISATASRVKAELVVMGRGGGRGLRETFLGSTAERVTRLGRRPVLVVRLPPRAAYHRPALVLDVDQAAHEIVRVMLRMLPPPRPRVTVVHAFDFPYGDAYPSLSHVETEEIKHQLQLEETRKLARVLAAALAKVKVAPGQAPHWKTYVRFGPPRLVVDTAVRRNDTDLLILGTRGRAGPVYVFLGTVAGDLLREVPCDVLVVPPAPARQKSPPAAATTRHR